MIHLQFFTPRLYEPLAISLTSQRNFDCLDIPQNILLVHFTDGDILIRPGDQEIVKEDAFEIHKHTQ